MRIIRCDNNGCESNKNGFCKKEVGYLDENGHCKKG